MVSVCLLRPRAAHLSAGRARRGAGVYHSRPPSGLPGCRSGWPARYWGTCPTPEKSLWGKRSIIAIGDIWWGRRRKAARSLDGVCHQAACLSGSCSLGSRPRIRQGPCCRRITSCARCASSGPCRLRCQARCQARAQNRRHLCRHTRHRLRHPSLPAFFRRRPPHRQAASTACLLRRTARSFQRTGSPASGRWR